MGMDEALMHHMPFVCVGHMYSKLHFYKRVKNSSSILKVISVGGLLAAYITTIFRDGYAHNRIMGYIAAIMGISMWMVVSISFEGKWRIFAKIGEASIVIMGLQGPVYDFWVKGYGMVLGLTREECLTKELHAAICCFAVVFICYATLFINKKIPWVLRAKQVQSV